MWHSGPQLICEVTRRTHDDETRLLQAFTDQATIAVNNARLLREIEERNTDLSESLELQTATSDILRLISAHPGELTTVLEGIVQRAIALCDADGGLAVIRYGDELEFATAVDHSTAHMFGHRYRASDEPALPDRRARDQQAPFLVDDYHATESIDPDRAVALFPLSRSLATVALMREDEWLGSIHIRREEVRPFGEEQARILQTFADQAAIAVANAKLFNDLDVALERQTAMTDVLEAVGTARLDVQPVFDRIVDHAQRLSDDTVAFISVRDQTELRTMAAAGPASPDAPAADYLGPTVDDEPPRPAWCTSPVNRSTSPTGARYLPIAIPTPAHETQVPERCSPSRCVGEATPSG